MRLDKENSRRRWSEARDLVNTWDPIGVMPHGFPADEYECIVGPLLRLLETNATVEQLAAYLEAEGSEHFGIDFQGSSEFAEKLKAWYDERWQGTNV